MENNKRFQRELEGEFRQFVKIAFICGIDCRTAGMCEGQITGAIVGAKSYDGIIGQMDYTALKSTLDKAVEEAQARKKELTYLKEAFEYYLYENDVIFRIDENEGNPQTDEKKIQDFLSGINFREMRLTESEAAESLRGVLAVS